MTAFAILRASKLKSVGSAAASIAHTHRERETPNANPEHTANNEHSHSSPGEVLQALKERLPEKHRKDAVLAIEYFVGTSPRWFKDKEGTEYFRAARAWLEKRHGAENVVGWSVHRDEKTPHMVAYVVPLDTSGRLNARKWLGGKAKLSEMQSEFHRDVGQWVGLARGIEGSKATHQRVQSFYSEIEKPIQQVTITPQSMEPRVLKKGFFRDEIEGPEHIAQRLTKDVRAAYAPAVEKAQVIELERRRAREMARTADMKDKALKVAQERLALVVQAVKPALDLIKLAPDQLRLFMDAMKTKVVEITQTNHQRELDQQRERGRDHDRGFSR